MSNDTTITIDPDYSSEAYGTLIAKNLPSAKTVILAKYPTADKIFSMTTGAMRDKGEWLVVWLKFKGDYSDNSDNLRILLKRTDTTWELATKPDIILTSINYPDVPVDILSWANAQSF